MQFYPRWKQGGSEATISWDVSGYYLYLPALFIYKDIKHCGFKDSMLKNYGPTPNFQQAFLDKTSGNFVMKYTSGQAFLMAPWFFIAHGFATNSSNYPADGFSFPYQICIGLGMLLYALLGLFVLRKVLGLYFKDSTVALVLLALVIGSNYLNYSAIDQAMTHSTLFMLYALIIWTTIHFYKEPKVHKAIILGSLCGFATLIRPTELLSLIIPLLWGVSSPEGLGQRLKFFRINPRYLFVGGIFCLLFIIIQPIYWKAVTGNRIVYSYQDQGFSWLTPHFYDYTFSYESGWLRYSPMMILSFAGLWVFIRQHKNVYAVVLFFLVNYYVVIAWDVWQYGGRAMVQSYPVIVFPLAALIEYVNTRRLAKLVFYPFFGLFIYLNSWWTYNSHAGTVQVAGVSRAYYKATVGRWVAPKDAWKLLDNPDRYSGDYKKRTTIYLNTFGTDTTQTINEERGTNGALLLDEEHPQTKSCSIALPQPTPKWIRASVAIQVEIREWTIWRMPQFIVTALDKNNREVKVAVLRIHRASEGAKTTNITLDMKLPDQQIDHLSIHFWNGDGEGKTILDNLQVEILE